MCLPLLLLWWTPWQPSQEQGQRQGQEPVRELQLQLQRQVADQVTCEKNPCTRSMLSWIKSWSCMAYFEGGFVAGLQLLQLHTPDTLQDTSLERRAAIFLLSTW